MEAMRRVRTPRSIKVLPQTESTTINKARRTSRKQLISKSRTKTSLSHQEKKKIANSRIYKLYELVVVIFCFILFIWQMGVSLHRYWQYPLTTLISISDISEIYLPSVTICNNNYRFSDMLLHFAGNVSNVGGFEAKNVSIDCCDKLDLFWRDYGVRIDDVYTYLPCDYYLQHNKSLKQCSDYRSFGELTTDKVVQSPLGQCIDLTLNYPAHQRIFGFAIRIKENENIKKLYSNNISFKTYYNIYAHDNDKFYKNDIFINTRAPQALELWISYEKKDFDRVNSPVNPCLQIKNHINCLDECVEKKLREEGTCKLPNMLSDLPKCKTWMDVLRSFEVVHRLHATGKLYSCSCGRACNAVEYKVNRIESMALDRNNGSLVSIELENRFDEKVEEHYVYPFSAVVNDFAALIGFFMGVSLPGLIDFVEVSGRRAIVYYQNHLHK